MATANTTNRIGFAIDGKEMNKLTKTWQLHQVQTIFAAAGYELVLLNINADFEAQGPFAAIFHKVFGLLEQFDEQTLKMEEYLERHPEVLIFDRPSNVRAVVDRRQQLRDLGNCPIMRESDAPVFVPPFVTLNSANLKENVKQLKEAKLKYPVVCKPLAGHGVGSHDMALVFNDAGLAQAKMPCVAQVFVNHNARLFKLFVLGAEHYIAERPSIKNFTLRSANCDVIHFSTTEVSKTNSNAPLNQLDEGDEAFIPWATIAQLPDPAIFARLATEIGTEFGLTFFGVDVIFDNDSGRYAVIDVNYLPSYKCKQISLEQVVVKCCETIVGQIEAVRRADEAVEEETEEFS